MAGEEQAMSHAAPDTTAHAVDALFEEMIVTPENAALSGASVGEAAEDLPVSWRPLPAAAQLDPQLAENASPWLAAYRKFSAEWSPRAYAGFHEATGLWVLSTAAARRIVLQLGGPRYSNLYIALAAWTGLWAKTTTVKIGLDVLRAASLRFLLAPDETTPQALVHSMTQRVPENWGQLSSAAQHKILQQLSFGGQKGWFYEELGQQVSAMMRQSGVMTDFRGLLRRIDDCPDIYRSATVGRGIDEIQRPYLAMLGNITPADLKPHARQGSGLWGDGFLARWALVTPPAANRGRGRFPPGTRVIPAALVEPLQDWHQRLGIPQVTIQALSQAKTEQPTGYEIQVAPFEPQECTLGPEVFERYYAYDNALLDLALELQIHDLDGSYVRFPEKCLRIAMLLASLENGGVIELRHWAKGQEIVEAWRLGLHRLYEQINAAEASPEQQFTEKIMRQVALRGPLTARELRQAIYGLSADLANSLLAELVAAGELEEAPAGRTTRYRLPVADDE